MKHDVWRRMDIHKSETGLKASKAKILFGIDGYVDEVWEIAESRSSGSTYAKYNQMKKFGQLIVDCEKGGLSTKIIRKRGTDLVDTLKNVKNEFAADYRSQRAQ